MLIYLVRRLFLAVVTVWAVTVISFAIILLPPGDFVTAYIAQLQTMGTIVSQAEAEALRIEYGLDKSVAVQYYKWVSRILNGDFGLAMEYRRPVLEVIGDRLALTAALTFTSIMFTWILAIPIGIYSAIRQYSLGDYFFTFVGFLGLALPNFLLALVVLYIGFVFFDANVGGLFSPEFAGEPYTWAKIMDLLNHLWLPSIILAVAGTAQLIRVLRANLLDELRKPYVVTARAKGLAAWRIIMKYPLRVALNPLVSTIGYLLPLIVSGSIIISVVMSLPTVGPLLLKALLAQDMFLAGTIILLIGVMTVIGTFISDLLLAWIDPRIKLETT
ncbi:ABC transporter permease [Candidatus Entotheonella palauensis]|uniref:ABC transporter permease n=1 Tax=Candidatus Entotheonella gemina TaxID=1429439 RepID=W4LY45_9BACT|nr:ABC transporter permease [Candidatus Entotheonella palauensis]ETX03029.1 MAG: ABC transporter permease [Candidatus Entotheonella gemina]